MTSLKHVPSSMTVIDPVALPVEAQVALALLAERGAVHASLDSRQAVSGAEVLLARGIALADHAAGETLYRLNPRGPRLAAICFGETQPRVQVDASVQAALDHARKVREEEAKRQRKIEAKARAFDELADALDLRLSEDGAWIVHSPVAIRTEQAATASLAVAARWRRMKTAVRDFLCGPGEEAARDAWASAKTDAEHSRIAVAIMDEAFELSGGNVVLSLDAIREVLGEAVQ